MIGAIIGDIVGSVFEWNNLKSKDFPFWTKNNFFTDDTVMTLAVAHSLLKDHSDLKGLQNRLVHDMQTIGLRYPDSGYGSHFMQWLLSKKPQPYNSYGNGAGMRISPVAYVGKTIEEVKLLSRAVTEVTHNHPEGLKAAEAIAVSTFLARQKTSKQAIKDYVEKHYYRLDFTLGEIRQDYHYDVTAQGSTPQAIVAFLEADDFEDAIRNAISIGGDSDTIAAMTGAIAEAYFGVPPTIKAQALKYLTKDLRSIYEAFQGFII